MYVIGASSLASSSGGTASASASFSGEETAPGKNLWKSLTAR